MIAIIISLYKNDTIEFVSKAIESILLQSYKSFDLYIQFDGKIRNDIDVYLSKISSDHLFIFKRSDNKGLAYSLNELLNIILPKGYQYIARMDADDISMPNRLEKQITFMERHPEIDCVGTWAIEIDSKGHEYFRKQMPITHDDCLELFKKRDCMIHPTVMFRHSYFEKVGLYPEDTYFGEDTMMWAKGFKAGCKFANLPEYLFKFRLDDRFFERRRGWKHAHSILSLRFKVNKMLGFGLKAYVFALLYACAKMMPKSILNIIYKTTR